MKLIELEELKKIQLDILKYTVEICNKYKLTYFLGGGTLLGAVRHKGYIPWDDDIDIMMPRKDYEKLLEVFNEESPEEYSLLSYRETTDYFYAFAKIVDFRTCLKEPELKLNENMGIYIDVFPIDYLSNNMKKNKKIFRKYQIMERLLSVNMLDDIGYSTESKMKLFIKRLVFPIIRWRKVSKYLLRKMDLLGSRYNGTQFVGCISGTYAEKEIMPSSYISTSTLLKFEGSEYTAPVGYKEYLVKHYGDYMKLPPKEQRKCTHGNIAFWRM